MKKAELIKKLEPYPDDIELFCLSGYDCDDLMPIESIHKRTMRDYEFSTPKKLDKEIILLGT